MLKVEPIAYPKLYITFRWMVVKRAPPNMSASINTFATTKEKGPITAHNTVDTWWLHRRPAANIATRMRVPYTNGGR